MLMPYKWYCEKYPSWALVAKRNIWQKAANGFRCCSENGTLQGTARAWNTKGGGMGAGLALQSRWCSLGLPAQRTTRKQGQKI